MGSTGLRAGLARAARQHARGCGVASVPRL